MNRPRASLAIRHAWPILLVCCCLALAIPVESLAKKSRPREFSGEVVKIADGDTITVLRGRKQVKVRLWGVDCPEKKMPHGSRARAFTGELCFRREVRVTPQAVDDYGRVVARVYLEDGRELNLELLRAGMAWWYQRYAPKASEYRAAHEKARAERVGLWADRDPTPPWEWRARKRKPDPWDGVFRKLLDMIR